MRDVTGNRVDPSGAAALAEALKVNKTVTVLGLRCERRAVVVCGCGDCGWWVVFGCVGNAVASAGAAAIAESLVVNNAVTTVELMGASCARVAGVGVVVA